MNLFRLSNIIPVAFFLIVSLCVTSSVLADNQVINVGIYENPPKVFTGESGQPAGIFVDIINYIAGKEGWKINFVHGTWAEGLERLSKGEIDLMPDVAFSAEREKKFRFHKVPVLSAWSQVYSAKGVKIQSFLDLDRKRVAVLEGSVQQESFMKLAGGFGINITFVSVPDYKTMFEVISQGKADAGITNRFYGLMHAKTAGLEETAVVFEPSNLFFAASPGVQGQIIDKIDLHLTNLREDQKSIYYSSLKKWTSEDVGFKMPLWLTIAGISLGIALTVSIAGSLFLKYQVDARTSELRAINQEMEERIMERTAELEEAMEKAQEADRIKSAFLATMSHELRTPLNSIIGFTGIMLQGLAGPLNPEQHKQMGMVQNSARHLLSLINDVLDISKIESGQLNLSRESFDLKTSIEKIVKIVSPMADKKGLELQTEISDDTGIINTDQRRIEQIILNLLNNAVKFTENGHVRISCRKQNNSYIMVFSDTGIGIKEEDISGLFQPFHQIDTGLARKHEGTGLGLSICSKIVEMMGGCISVKSTPDSGSVFTVQIPVDTGELNAQE